MAEVGEQSPTGKDGVFLNVHTTDMACAKLGCRREHDPTSDPEFQDVLPANDLRTALDSLDQTGCAFAGAKSSYGGGG